MLVVFKLSMYIQVGFLLAHGFIMRIRVFPDSHCVDKTIHSIQILIQTLEKITRIMLPAFDRPSISQSYFLINPYTTINDVASTTSVSIVVYLHSSYLKDKHKKLLEVIPGFKI